MFFFAVECKLTRKNYVETVQVSIFLFNVSDVWMNIFRALETVTSLSSRQPGVQEKSIVVATVVSGPNWAQIDQI